MQVLPLMKRLQERHWSGPGPQQPSLEHNSLHTIPSAAAKRQHSIINLRSPLKRKGKHFIQQSAILRNVNWTFSFSRNRIEKNQKIIIITLQIQTVHSQFEYYTHFWSVPFRKDIVEWEKALRALHGWSKLEKSFYTKNKQMSSLRYGWERTW